MRESEENDAKVRIGGVVRTVCARERGRESKGGWLLSSGNFEKGEWAQCASHAE